MLYIDASFNSEFGVPTSSGTDLDVEFPVAIVMSVAEIVDTLYSAVGPEFKVEDISSYFSAAPYITQALLDTLFFYNTGQTKVQNYTDYTVDFIAGIKYAGGVVPLSHHLFVEDPISLYQSMSYYYTAKTQISGVRYGVRDHEFIITTVTGVSGTENTQVDITFNGYVMRPFESFVTCGIATRFGPCPFELETVSGSVLAQNYDVYCGIQDVEYFDVSCFCGEELTPNFLFGSSVVDGFIDNLNYDVYCGTLYSNVIDFDVWILSLKLENIVPRQGDYLSVEGAICVDVVDDIYDVVTSGTYFLVNDTQVSGTFTAITDGYTMCYNPTDNFSNVDGPVEITVHAENTNGDKLEQSFYLTSGYLVEYKNAFYLGPGRRVYIRLSAENYASCPSLGAVGYWFETADTIPKDLAATIIGVRDIEQNDLTATIYPNSTAYFYGKKFTVELRARDYAGNEMKPHIFEFKIEDKIEES